MSAVSGDKDQRAVVAPGVKPPLAVPRRLLKMRSDATLAERFAAGDEMAFDVLYERHRPVVLAVSMGVLGTTQDAEDATQETFSALAVALRSKPPAEMRPWLIRVARNASIDTTRRRRHRLLTLDGEIPDIPARPAGAGQAELAMVLDGIRDLPEGQRMALLMRELGGHTYAEIAEFLETDEEAVKGLIARARVGLRTYREATELPCATARSTIAAEPDGRRYDKTIRRHLRNCHSCRSYRAALRSDAKTLRAALPLPAGGVATGGISTGALAAAKGAVLGYGLTQAAATCAASVCAVGAVGGMVFIAPIHRFGIEPILPPAKSAPAHHEQKVTHAATGHAVATAATPSTVVANQHASVTTQPVKSHSHKKAVHHAAAHRAVVTQRVHHHHKPSPTVVKLPSTLATHQKKATPTKIVATVPATQVQDPTQTVIQTPTQTVAQTPTQTQTVTATQTPTQTTSGSATAVGPAVSTGTTTVTDPDTTTTPSTTTTATTPTQTATTPTQTATTPTQTGTTPTITQTQTTSGSTVPAWGTSGSHHHGQGWHQGSTTVTTPTPTTPTPTTSTPMATTPSVATVSTTTSTSPSYTATTPEQGWGPSDQSGWSGSYSHHR